MRPTFSVICRSAISTGIAALAILTISACQTAPPRPSSAPKLPALPPLVTANAIHYRINSARSEVRFLVYPGGTFAGLGHHHVIIAGTVTGSIYLNTDFQKSGFELTMPLKDFEVDPSGARAVEGPDFARQPTAEAIAGTRKNMLGASELDAGQYPLINVRSVGMVGPRWQPDITIRITLHGTERQMTVPVVLEENDNRLIAIGTFDIRQSAFGIQPLSILGGAIAVQDRVKIRFRIVATRDQVSESDSTLMRS